MTKRKGTRDQKFAKTTKKTAPAADIASSDEKYVTELDYVSTWDVLQYQPSDSFMYGIEQTVTAPLSEEARGRG
jgi:hypothetical protein